jgi:putative tryptophan/tyrosine transport system substrate-binding protein
MRRREFMAGLGSAAAWPLAVRAQQPALPVIGYLGLAAPDPNSPAVTSFRRGLADSGFAEGQNVMFEFRWANNDVRRLQALAAELVRRRVAVIVATGSPALVLAAKAATSTIPIVFATAVDPVKYGLVASLNRPNGTATGISFLTSALAGKQLDLLLEMIPQAMTVAYLSGPSTAPVFEDLRSSMLSAAQGLGRQIVVLESRRDHDLDVAFATLVERQASALIVGGFTSLAEPPSRQKIIELAAHHMIPTMYPSRVYPLGGGLMSYSADVDAAYRQLGADYVGRILKGTKPADLPVRQPTGAAFLAREFGEKSSSFQALAGLSRTEQRSGRGRKACCRSACSVCSYPSFALILIVSGEKSAGSHSPTCCGRVIGIMFGTRT